MLEAASLVVTDVLLGPGGGGRVGAEGMENRGMSTDAMFSHKLYT